ncbi:MAG: DUF1622 domain-containing protein [Acidobacteriota bacterium]
MSEVVHVIAEWSAAIIETVGVLLIAVLSLYALLAAGVDRLRGAAVDTVYHTARVRLGRSILLGLELLVAADIIHTVAVELSFETVGVLAIIVVIRTFLSFTLGVEVTGRWPWQHDPSSESSTNTV